MSLLRVASPLSCEPSIAEGDVRIGGLSTGDGSVILCNEQNTPLPRKRGRNAREECRLDVFCRRLSRNEPEEGPERDVEALWKSRRQKRILEDDRKV
jgi:hypothetical protein